MLLLTEAGELDRALRLAERVVEQKRKLFGPDDVQVAIALHNEGMVRGRLGQHELARRRHEASLVTWERTVGPDHVDLANPLEGVAEACIELDRPSEALAAGQRALALHEQHGDAPGTELLFTLARALWATGDRVGARAAVVRAAESIPPDGHRRPGQVGRDVLAQWLRLHGDAAPNG